MDTIFALSTPPGKSGVAILRVSGPKSLDTLSALGVSPLPAPRMATLATLRSPSIEASRPTSPEHEHSEHLICESAGEQGEKYQIIDKALVLYFPAPHSFTGEDVVEYHIHGSRAVIQQMLHIFSTLPSLCVAEPGEFSRRAFFNGKMDLTATEALADLIDAETEAQRKQAIRVMQGESAVFYDKLRAGILHALAYLEAYIDFPDEDIPDHVLAEIDTELQSIDALITHQLTDNNAGERIRDGVRVAIIGPPNAGKSSLMNLLAKRDVAIVSEIAGTTRDVIEVHLDIGGYCVILSDTAGIRDHADSIEQEGIRRSFARAKEADITLLMLDAQEAVASDKSQVVSMEPLITENTIILLNKCDLVLYPLIPDPRPLPLPFLPISIKTRTGLDVLMDALEEKITAVCPPESSFITRARHRIHLTHALEHIRKYVALRESGLELRCEELRRAATEIGAITGAIAVEELLGHIFSSFCIGK